MSGGDYSGNCGGYPNVSVGASGGGSNFRWRFNWNF